MFCIRKCCLLLIGGWMLASIATAQDVPAVPVEYYQLSNGLKVILSPNPRSAQVTVAVYYHFGFRAEGRGQAGFAHLLEHLSFQGSRYLKRDRLGKRIKRSGGTFNAATRADFTQYYAAIPPAMLQPVLQAEAGRMQRLDLSQKVFRLQKEVVNNELRVNVLNQPYGGFPWLEMPGYAFSNWQNAHNSYGHPASLDTVTLEEMKRLFRSCYVPNNAVLVLAGNFERTRAVGWIKTYFGTLTAAVLPVLPDTREPRQVAEKRRTTTDSRIPQPAIAVAYKMPPRNTPEYFAMGLVDQLLVKGNDSRLYQRLVHQKRYTAQVNGGINYLGDMFTSNDPMLWMTHLIHGSGISADSVVAELDAALADLLNHMNEDLLQLAKNKMCAALREQSPGSSGLGWVDRLACFALFDDNAARVNQLEEGFEQVDIPLIKKTILEWMRPSNRTILVVEPAPDQLRNHNSGFR